MKSIGNIRSHIRKILITGTLSLTGCSSEFDSLRSYLPPYPYTAYPIEFTSLDYKIDLKNGDAPDLGVSLVTPSVFSIPSSIPLIFPYIDFTEAIGYTPTAPPSDDLEDLVCDPYTNSVRPAGITNSNGSQLYEMHLYEGCDFSTSNEIQQATDINKLKIPLGGKLELFVAGSYNLGNNVQYTTQFFNDDLGIISFEQKEAKNGIGRVTLHGLNIGTTTIRIDSINPDTNPATDYAELVNVVVE